MEKSMLTVLSDFFSKYCIDVWQIDYTSYNSTFQSFHQCSYMIIFVIIISILSHGNVFKPEIAVRLSKIESCFSNYRITKSIEQWNCTKVNISINVISFPELYIYVQEHMFQDFTSNNLQVNLEIWIVIAESCSNVI
jgi:hypothetical protein